MGTIHMNNQLSPWNYMKISLNRANCCCCPYGLLSCSVPYGLFPPALREGRYLTMRIHLPAKTGSEGAEIGAQVVQYRMSVVSQRGLFRLLLGSPVPSLEKCIFFLYVCIFLFYVIPFHRIFLFLSKWEESKGRAYKEESSISNQESSPAGIKKMNRG